VVVVVFVIVMRFITMVVVIFVLEIMVALVFSVIWGVVLVDQRW
jgi:hypothetical protein